MLADSRPAAVLGTASLPAEQFDLAGCSSVKLPVYGVAEQGAGVGGKQEQIASVALTLQVSSVASGMLEGPLATKTSVCWPDCSIILQSASHEQQLSCCWKFSCQCTLLQQTSLLHYEGCRRHLIVWSQTVCWPDCSVILQSASHDRQISHC